MFWWDPTYILVIIGALICAAASSNVNSTYRKYSSVRNVQGYTSQQVAQWILNSAGIYDVRIERIRGDLTDHYSPEEKVLRLSDTVYGSTSVAAIGVAAHECGHAIQHQVDYVPLKIRSSLVPVTNIGASFSWPLLLLGLILGLPGLARAGVILFTVVVVFQLVTLPVEFDASGRAMKILKRDNILLGDELNGAGNVLKAAAMTYVASLFSSVLQLFRLLLITQGSSDSRRR